MSSPISNNVQRNIRTSIPMYVYITIGVVGILISYALYYSTLLGTRSVRDLSNIVGVAHEIRTESAMAHLWAEEILAYDTSVTEEDVWSHLGLAEDNMHLLEDTLNERIAPSAAISDKLMGLFERSHKNLDKVLEITELRLKTRDASAPGSEIDQEFDEAFSVLLTDLVGLEGLVKELVESEIFRFRNTQTVVIIMIIFLSVIVVCMIRTFDRNRSEDMKTIHDLNLNLEAGNQQLRASEQQAKASEQQLRASNQQLRASEQQAKASEQQLRASEEALRWSEEHYRTIFSTAPNLIISLNTEGKVIECNGRSRDILGYEPDEIIDQPFDLYVEPCVDGASRFKAEQITGGGLTVNKELRMRKKDGDTVEIRMNASSIKGSGSVSDMTVCVIEDVTRINRFQQEMQNIQKLESLGVLAGGIAHDFNNLLTVIVANISLTRLSLDSGSKADIRLADAEKATERAKDLSNQLLTFSKGGDPVKRTAYLGDLISESASFAFRGTNTACDISTPESVWPVHIDVGQITQVLHNLFINADQAMPGGGTVHVACENVTLESNDEVPPLSAGSYVNISIRDSGVGISEDHVDRIFDPYYTTKQQGSGLGLAISHSIIKKHDGHINVETKPDEGTVFNIYLPASKEKEVMPRTSYETVLTGSGRVLLMDDEAEIRKSTAKILSYIGYDVSLARNAKEAIDMFLAVHGSENCFDIVLLDLTIPGGIGGREVIEKLIEIDPDVKAIVMSGYSNDPVLSDHKKYGFRGVLIKPFKVNDIAEVLNRVLEN